MAADKQNPHASTTLTGWRKILAEEASYCSLVAIVAFFVSAGWIIALYVHGPNDAATRQFIVHGIFYALPAVVCLAGIAIIADTRAEKRRQEERLKRSLTASTRQKRLRSDNYVI